MGMEGGVEAAAPAPLKQEGNGEREEGLTMVERRGGLRLVERRGPKHGRDALVHSPGGRRPDWGGQEIEEKRKRDGSREYDQNMSNRRGDSAARERNQVEVETKEDSAGEAGGRTTSVGRKWTRTVQKSGKHHGKNRDSGRES